MLVGRVRKDTRVRRPGGPPTLSSVSSFPLRPRLGFGPRWNLRNSRRCTFVELREHRVILRLRLVWAIASFNLASIFLEICKTTVGAVKVLELYALYPILCYHFAFPNGRFTRTRFGVTTTLVPWLFPSVKVSIILLIVSETALIGIILVNAFFSASDSLIIIIARWEF